MDNYLRNLPLHGYQDNFAVIAIASAIDEILNELVKLKDAYQSGVSLSGPYYDYTALFLGLVSLGFWDVNWPDSTKLNVLNNSNTILGNYGTRESLEIALMYIVPSYVGIWVGTETLLADVAVAGDAIGSAIPFVYYILMSNGTSRAGIDWAQALDIAKTFTPAVTQALVTYENAVADSAVAGDPVFT